MDMKITPKLSRRHLPVRLPVTNTIAWIVFLEYFHAPQWAKWIVWVMIGLNWLLTIVGLVREKNFRLFADAELKDLEPTTDKPTPEVKWTKS
jgi:hypothetical protein